MGTTANRWRRDTRAAWRVIEGRTIVVGGREGRCYVLNPSGTCVWQALLEVASTEALVSAVVTRFAVEPAAAIADVDSFLQQMQQRGLVEAAP